MKKLLALVLALVMVMGLATVGASATTFSDDADIDHQEAVEVMNALNIINGMGDGKFDPNGNVTRAQMAKMVTISLLGDVEVSAFTGTATDLKDVSGHWAEGYIKYCYSQGIISGRGNGIFDPNANVTTAEASKMLLVALGYNSDVRKYTGDQWAINVARDAQQKGLYDEIENLTSNKPMDRDDAAQLIYNTLNAERVIERQSINSDGTTTLSYLDATAAGVAADKRNLLGATFSTNTAEGYFTGASYNEDTKKFTYTVHVDTVTGGVVTTAATILGAGTAVNAETAEDYSDMLGLPVKMLWKNDTKANKNVCYGIYVDDATTQTASVGELAVVTAGVGESKAKLADTEYKLNAAFDATPAYMFLTTKMDEVDGGAGTNYFLDDILPAGATGATVSTTEDQDPASTFTLVDKGKDGKYDYAIITPLTVHEVTYVGSKSITAGANYTFEDDVIADGIVKGDFVTVIAAANSVFGKDKIDKVGTVSGKVTGLRGTEVQLGGAWYKQAQNNGDTLALNKEFELDVIGGYYYNASLKDEAIELDKLVFAIDEDAAASMGVLKVKFLDTNGNTVVKDVTKVDGVTVSTTNLVSAAAGATSNNMYTYKEKDGSWELTTVDADTFGYKYGDNTGANYVKKANDAAAHIGSYQIADDAVIYVHSGDSTADKVITGKALNGWDNDVTLTSSFVLYKTVSGVKYITVADLSTAANRPADSGETGNYAYITSKPYTQEIDDDTYLVYDIWTGTETVTVYDDTDGTAGTIAQDAVIEYTDLGAFENGKKITDAKANLFTTVAITGYGDNIMTSAKLDGTLFGDTTINSKTIILYVDTKEHKGVEGGSLAIAQTQSNGSRIANAYVTTTNSSGKLKLIVFDVNNDIEGLANTVGTGACGIDLDWSSGRPSVTDTGSWDVSVDSIKVGDVVAGSNAHWYGIEGEKVVITVKGGTTGNDSLGTTITLTGGTGATAEVVTAPTFTTASGTAATIAPSDATITVTKNNSTKMVGGEYTFTWVLGASNTYSITSANS